MQVVLVELIIYNCKGMKTQLYLLVFILAFPFLGINQNQEGCGSDVLLRQSQEENELFRRRLFNLENRLIEHRSTPGFELRDGDICVIPTVVHIIHTGEDVGTGSNISDEQIQSAIDALNEDFRKVSGTNGDGIGVDVGIEFCLAIRDPDGNGTNGINRVDGSSVQNYATEGIIIEHDNAPNSEEPVKALSFWPKDDYLNIWIVNEIEDNDGNSGIQGFAHFPINSFKDGITILHNAFGTVGNLKSYTNLNRTTTHEVGHFLGLYHTFHSSTDCIESNCETQGDRVCDTPVTLLNSNCSNPECSGSQMIENYMDYTGQTCKNSFTEGQKVRMRFTLFEERESLLTSLGCVPTSEYDVAVTSIKAPIGSLCSGTLFPEVVIYNYGSQTLTTATIHYSVDNNSAQTFNWTGSLNSGENEEVGLPTLTAGGGNHTFDAYTSSPNGNTDSYPSNDGSQSNFSIGTGGIAEVNIKLDYIGTETTWEIFQGGNLAASGGPYNDNSPGIVSHDVCLNPGCYTFYIYDEGGNGFDFLTGHYEVLDGDGNQAIFGQNNFGSSATGEFCMETPVGDPPVTSFSASSNSIFEGESINFTDTSTENPSNWHWQFDGGSPGSSTVQNPQNITYASPGSYTVTLITSNAYGADTRTQTAYITVQELVQENPPTASFGTSENSIFTGENIDFTDMSTEDPTSWSWQFTGGSPSSSALQNPQNITYNSPGNYTVTLTATNAHGSDSYSSNIQVQAVVEQNPPVASFTATANSILEGESVHFSDTSSENPTSWSWQFDGGSPSTSNAQNPQNIVYSAPGSYAVTLTTSNEFGSDTHTESGYISVQEIVAGDAPISSFTASSNSICIGESLSFSDTSSGDPTSWAWEFQAGAPASSDSQNPQNIVYSTPGTHTVTLITTNEHGSHTRTVNITVQAAPDILLNTSDISCAGLTDGQASVNANGASSIIWSNDQSGNTITGLSVGDYTVTAASSAGCASTLEFNISEPLSLGLTIFKSDVSCHGLSDGTASASVTGGSTPYSYDWSNGMDDANLSGLDQDILTLTITDARDCTISEEIAIVEPSEITISVSDIVAETCAGSNGSAIANALGGSGSITYSWSNDTQEQSLANVSFGTYVVTATDLSGCSVSTTFDIPYDCEDITPTTQLISNQCGASGLELDESLYCNAVPGAEMYLWSFTSATGMLIEEIYTMGNNNSIMIGELDNVTYGDLFNVRIKVEKNQEWGEWGNSCTISMDNDLPLLTLLESDCTSGILSIGYTLKAESNSGANEFEWTFIVGDDQSQYYTYIDQIMISEDMALLPAEVVLVSVKGKFGDTWGESGAPCSFTYEVIDNVNGLPDIDDSILSLYPNPNSGEQFSLDLHNLPPGNHVIDIKIFDSNGKLITEWIKQNNGITHISETYSFDNKLSKGMYLVQVDFAGRKYQQKLIVK